MPKEWVGLLDCNNFFVSCERLFRPDLLGKPVVVLSSNDGCIVARSQEVKDMNVPMGVPYFQVKDILEASNTTAFSGNHALYRNLSKRVFAVMRECIDDIEQYSVDEAFFLLDDATAVEKMSFIKDTVENEIGIPVSVGVGRSKTLAKVAGSIAKKNGGLFFLTDERWNERVKETKLHEIWGIGGKLSKRLGDHKLLTVDDLLQADAATCKKLFGVVGERLRKELSGNAQAVLGGRSTQKSFMSSRSFGAETTSLGVLEEAVAMHVDRVAFDLRLINHKASSMRVYIAPSRYGDFALQNQVKEYFFDTPTSNTKDLLVAATGVLRAMYVAGVPYKKAGVVLSTLVPDNVSQQSLFAVEAVEKTDSLQTTIDAINKQKTSSKVHYGFIEGKRAYTPKTDSRSPDYVTNWKDIPNVQAK